MKTRVKAKRFLLLLSVISLLFAALYYIMNQQYKIDILIKKNNEQTTHIQKLESDVKVLESDLVKEHSQIQELQHTKTEVPDTHKDYVEENPIFNPETAIVSFFVVLRGLATHLVPSH